jgi:hypothetical protein
MPRMLLIAAVMLAFVPTAGAQESDRQRGDRLCKNDAVKLCKPVLSQGDFAILACFQQHAPRLSRGCREFLQQMGQL